MFNTAEYCDVIIKELQTRLPEYIINNKQFADFSAIVITGALQHLHVSCGVHLFKSADCSWDKSEYIGPGIYIGVYSHGYRADNEKGHIFIPIACDPIDKLVNIITTELPNATTIERTKIPFKENGTI